MRFWLKLLLLILASSLALALIGAFFGTWGLAATVPVISLAIAAFLVTSVWAVLSGARVVSYGFRLPYWLGEEETYPNIYRYRQPQRDLSLTLDKIVDL